jgi:prolyl-tRNA editing enzyme YbaK/EbsC (Cys-tRNA(Pro) deacylase)
MTKPLSSAAQKVQDALDQFKLGHTVLELEVPVKTAQQAADAVSCEVAQIAKSLIFKSSDTNRPVLVITSGANRVSEARVESLLNEGISRADPEFVRVNTGFSIGGIPPLAHVVPPVVLIDEDLLLFKVIWAAAGHPNSLFKLDPNDLPRMTGGTVALVKEDRS